MLSILQRCAAVECGEAGGLQHGVDHRRSHRVNTPDTPRASAARSPRSTYMSMNPLSRGLCEHCRRSHAVLGGAVELTSLAHCYASRNGGSQSERGTDIALQRRGPVYRHRHGRNGSLQSRSAPALHTQGGLGGAALVPLLMLTRQYCCPIGLELIWEWFA